MLPASRVSSVSTIRLRDAPPMPCQRPVRSLSHARRRLATARYAGARPSVSVEAVKQAAVLAPERGKSSAEQIGLGRWDEASLSYKEYALVRSNEVGVNKTATIVAIAKLLQEVGCNHAQSLGFSKDGFGTTTAMRRLGLIWVTNRMHIEMQKYPAWGDVIEIEKWCDIDGRISTRRDWIIKDFTTSEVIGRCTSSWALMNQETRKLERVVAVRDDLRAFCPNRFAFPKEDKGTLKKVPKLTEPGEYSRLGLMPGRADLDMNQHVNFATYIGWFLDSMPQHIIDTHELKTITLEYKRECHFDNMVDSLTSLEQADHEATKESTVEMQHAGEDHHFLHLLRFSDSRLEINRGRTVWRKLVR